MSVLSMAFLLGSTLAAAEPVSGDLVRVQGVWSAQAGPAKSILVELEIQGRSVRLRIVPPVGAPIRTEGELAVDDSVSPKRLDWTKFSLPDGQEIPAILAIYELDGETLRVCNGGPNNPRPTQFEPGEGVLADVVVFRKRTDLATKDTSPRR